jgi:DNA-binding response OmpR family regulator
LTTTNALHHALILVEHDGLSGAILDHALGDGDSSLVYARLKERGIPFLIYSGFDTVGGASAGALHVSKPAAPGELVAKMEKLILKSDRTVPLTCRAAPDAQHHRRRSAITGCEARDRERACQEPCEPTRARRYID